MTSKNGGSVWKRMLVTVLLVALLFFSLTILNQTPPEESRLSGIDARAQEYFDETLARAAFTFALARAMNAIVSVIKDTELSIQPGGLGATIAIGEVVDPVDDLLERFSWVMLLSTISLGVQKVLAQIGVWAGFGVMLSLAAVVGLIGVWFPRAGTLNLRALGFKLFVLALVVRYGMPLAALAGENAYYVFLSKPYEQAAGSLEKTSEAMKKDALANQDDEDSPGFLGALQGLLGGDKAREVRARIEAIKDRLQNAVQLLINLIIVFLFQTVIIPLIVLWLLVKLLGWVLGLGLGPLLPTRTADA